MIERGGADLAGRATSARVGMAFLGVLAAVVALALATSPAGAQRIVSASYSGNVSGGGRVSFTLRRHGSRVRGFGVRRVTARCEFTPARKVDADIPSTLRVSRAGRFRGKYDGPASGLTVTGVVRAGGRASGRVTYVDRGGCTFNHHFSAHSSSPRFTG